MKRIWKFMLLAQITFIGKAMTFIMDLSLVDASNGDMRITLCDFPNLSSFTDQIMLPSYIFSLDSGGTIQGNISLVQVGELDDNFVIPTDPEENTADLYESTAAESELSFRSPVAVTWRNGKFKSMMQRDHYSWIYLFNCLFKSKPDIHLKSFTTQEEVDNVFLMILSLPQWEMYLRVNPDLEKHPSRNKQGFVHYSQLLGLYRCPIRKVGYAYKFNFTATEPQRFIVLLLNMDHRKMKIAGAIEYMNPNNNHLPVEYIHHRMILNFWVIIYITSAIMILVYSFSIFGCKLKTIHYLLVLNLLGAALHLLLDRKIMESIMNTGHYSIAQWALSHLTRRFHEVYILAILVLLALGWQVTREHLSLVEFQMITSVICISVFLGFFEVFVNGTSVSRYLIQSISFVCILVATNFNSIVVHSRIADENLTAHIGAAYLQLKSFTTFRIIFFFNVFKPAVFSCLRFLCLQANYEQLFVWDENILLFLNLAYDYWIYISYYCCFMPPRDNGLFKELFS